MKTRLVQIGILLGSVTCLAWLLGLEWPPRLSGDWMPSEPVTSFGLITVGVAMLMQNGKRWVSRMISTYLALCVVFAMNVIHFEAAHEFEGGLSSLLSFLHDDRLGAPSVSTVLAISFLSMSMLVRELDMKRLSFWMSLLATLIGLCGAVSYLFDWPHFSISAPGFSSTMALHTALVVSLFGLSSLMSKNDGNQLST